jgi:ribosomal RNA assembly protein
MEIIRIPAERVAKLIGKGGDSKELLELKLKVSIKVTGDGEVELNGESVDEFFAKDVIRAIGRGFEPHVALRLLGEDFALRIIDLRDYGSKDHFARLKGRVIGEDGRSKEIIEEQTDSVLCIYGHTISIIAKLEDLATASEAVFKLLEGSNHSTVFGYLEKMHRKKKDRELLGRTQ